jgi:hypothetical protein
VTEVVGVFVRFRAPLHPKHWDKQTKDQNKKPNFAAIYKA